ncbi:MAG: RsmG family class I SAM-dependent methyltransferase [Acidimicrobiales bacterium]
MRALLLEAVETPVLELGSGGGLPGLVMALEDQELRLVLVDSARRSVEFLRWAVDELEISERVDIVHARAEQVGRDPRYREGFAAVLARSFGPPAVTAECAAPLLRVGGRLIVSEPPAKDPVQDLALASLPAPDRWPPQGCAELGLKPELALRDPFGFAVIRQVSQCPERFPRRTGIPAKRPLFS